MKSLICYPTLNICLLLFDVCKYVQALLYIRLMFNLYI